MINVIDGDGVANFLTRFANATSGRKRLRNGKSFGNRFGLVFKDVIAGVVLVVVKRWRIGKLGTIDDNGWFFDGKYRKNAHG